MDPFQQLLGNPNPLQSLLQPQQPYAAAPSAMPMPSAAMPDLSALAGPGASSPLAAIAAALSGGGAGGPSPMDEVPSASYADHLAEAGPNSGSALAGLGPDLQQSLGLGAGSSAMTAGGGGTGQYTLGDVPVSSGYTPPPTPPGPLDERTLHPSGTRNLMQGVVPGIAALIAGLTGGKLAAAATLQGANAGNQAYNADLKERGLRKYQEAQQSYARDHQLWQDEQQRLEHNTSIIQALAEKAKSFANPADGLAWLKSQAPLYAKQGINVMDAWRGVEVGADTRRKDYLGGKLKTVIDKMRQDAKDAGRLFDESKLDETMAIRIDGETKPLSVWRELTDALPVSAGRSATTSAIEQKVESEVQDHIAMIRANTGREPLPAEIAQLRKDEWQKVATDEKLSDEAKRLAVEHLKKQIAYLDAQAGHLRDAGGSLTTAQQMFGRSRSTEIARNKVLQNAQTMGSIYDQFLTTMDDPHPNGVTDQTLIAEFIRAKHPGSARIGDEESMRIQLAREGIRNPEAVARQWWNGTALLPEQRAQMADVLKRAYEAQVGGAEMLLDGYQQELEAQHVPPQIFMLPEIGSKNLPIRPRWAREEDAKAEAAVAAQDAGFAAAEKAGGIQPVAPDSVPGQGTRMQGKTAPSTPTKTPTTGGFRLRNPFRGGEQKTGPAQVGEERIVNGEWARWDGKNWVTF